MPASDDDSPNAPPNDVSVLCPLGQFNWHDLSPTSSTSLSAVPVLFQRLGGKARRASGDLNGVISMLGDAIQDRTTDIRIAAANTFGHFGRETMAYSGDATSATVTAASALSVALTDRMLAVREAVLKSLANFSTMASPALVDRVSRTAEDADPHVRRASIAALRAFGPGAPLAVVAALVRVVAAPRAEDDELINLAIEGLADCGQDAASEAVDTLAVVVRDGRLATDTRIAACKVLGWLGPDAKPANSALADVIVGAGSNSITTEVRVAATHALIRVADVSELALRTTHAEQRRSFSPSSGRSVRKRRMQGGHFRLRGNRDRLR